LKNQTTNQTEVGELAFTKSAYLHPKFWPTWLVLSLFWLLSRPSFDTSLAIGRRVGQALSYLIPKRRRVTATNIALAFPDLSSADQKSMLKSTYDHLGMTLAETAWLWFKGMDAIEDRFSVSGLEHLDAALNKDEGVILLQAHFSTLEIAGGYVGPRWPIAAVYDPPKNKMAADWLVAQRRRRINPMIDNKNIRDMIRHLKKGHTVWYSPDQTVSKSQGGIPTRYFDQPVLTSNGSSRIVRMTKATIIPMIPTRHNNGKSYHIAFFSPLELDTSDETQSTQTMNDLFEKHVTRYPEQYLWLHKRFKPIDGAANPYA